MRRSGAARATHQRMRAQAQRREAFRLADCPSCALFFATLSARFSLRFADFRHTDLISFHAIIFFADYFHLFLPHA